MKNNLRFLRSNPEFAFTWLDPERTVTRSMLDLNHLNADDSDGTSAKRLFYPSEHVAVVANSGNLSNNLFGAWVPSVPTAMVMVSSPKGPSKVTCAWRPARSPASTTTTRWPGSACDSRASYDPKLPVALLWLRFSSRWPWPSSSSSSRW